MKFIGTAFITILIVEKDLVESEAGTVPHQYILHFLIVPIPTAFFPVQGLS